MSVSLDDAVGAGYPGGEILLNAGGSESQHRMSNCGVLFGLWKMYH